MCKHQLQVISPHFYTPRVAKWTQKWLSLFVNWWYLLGTLSPFVLAQLKPLRYHGENNFYPFVVGEMGSPASLGGVETWASTVDRAAEATENGIAHSIHEIRVCRARIRSIIILIIICTNYFSHRVIITLSISLSLPMHTSLAIWCILPDLMIFPSLLHTPSPWKSPHWPNISYISERCALFGCNGSITSK